MGRFEGLLGGLAFLFAMALAAHPCFAQTDAEWQSVIAAAKKEGKVVLYNGIPPRIARSAADLFEREYGISVDIISARSSSLRERIRTEQAVGRNIGDVVANGIGSATTLKTGGALQAHPALPNVADLKPPFTGDGTLVPFRVGFYVMLINTNLVKPQDEPKSWMDVLDPKWTGKILMDDPRASSQGYVFFEALLAKYGRSYHEKLAAMKPMIGREVAEDLKRVGRGEYALYFPMQVADYLDLKGLPLKMIAGSEGSPYVELVYSMQKGAPHPNAARLFLNFMLSREVQTMVADFGAFSVTGQTSSKTPPEVRSLPVQFLGTNDPDRQNEMLKLASEIYK